MAGEKLVQLRRIMHDPLRLVLFGQPRTKGNIQSSVWSRKSKKQVRFKDPEVEAYELGLQGQVRAQLREQGLEDADLPVFKVPVAASFWFFFSRRPTSCDVANYFKSVCDALNGLVWLDDRLITRIEGSKHHDKERPRIEIEVSDRVLFADCPAIVARLIERAGLPKGTVLDLGVANGWSADPEIVQHCRAKGHKTSDSRLASPHLRAVRCQICRYRYTYDSS